MTRFRIIDRYVFSLFLRVFLVCFMSLTGIYIVGDFVNNLTEFIEMANLRGGMLEALISYYGVRIPWFFDLIGNVTTLISAVFAITWLQRHNEMAALMAAGMSRWRIMRPILMGVVIATVLGIANREFILPAYQHALSQKAQDVISKRSKPMTTQLDQITNIRISGKGVVLKDRKIEKPRFHLPVAFASMGLQIKAEFAVRQPASSNHPAGFLVTKISEPKNVDQRDSLSLDDREIILTRKQHQWLEPNQCFIVCQVSLTQLTAGKAWQHFSSTRNLVRAMNNPSLDLGNRVPVTVHARIVKPILDIALFFLGVPVVLSRESRNVFVAVGSCLLIVVVFIATILASHSLGINYILSPAQAAWMPLAILIPWAAFTSDPFFR